MGLHIVWRNLLSQTITADISVMFYLSSISINKTNATATIIYVFVMLSAHLVIIPVSIIFITDRLATMYANVLVHITHFFSELHQMEIDGMSSRPFVKELSRSSLIVAGNLS